MNFLKKYFIPHRKNDYQPHVLRKVSVVGLFVLVVGLFVVAVSGPFILRNTSMTALVLPRVLVDYANQDRLTANYPELTINPVLQKAAQMKANDMAQKGYFAHKSPDGHSPWYWFGQAGYDFAYAGENLAVNFTDSVDVNTAWMNSPGHRANIMNSHFTEIGVATADGTYEGRPTTFVVQLFGTPTDLTSTSNLTGQAPTNLNSTSNSTAQATTQLRVAKAPAKNSSTKPILSTIASSSVLGASEVNDLYVAVENKSAVKGTSTTAVPHYSSWVEQVMLSPKKLLSFSYLIIALIVVCGLLFTIFIEIKKQHPYLILSALFLLFVICTLLYIYQSVIFAPLLIV